MIFLALKTEDGRIKGEIAFYCRMLGVSRQGLYGYLANKDRPWKYQDLTNAMKEIIREDECNDAYGRIWMYQALLLKQLKGVSIPSERTVYRVIDQIGLSHGPKRKPNGITKANREAMKSDLCVHTLENSLIAYPSLKGAIIHSDRGTQYTSEAYRKVLRDNYIRQSMNSAGGCCHDNARCESIWARMKTELSYDRNNTGQMTIEALKILIWRYFLSYWNNRRICSATGGLPPMLKRKQYYETLELAA